MNAFLPCAPCRCDDVRVVAVPFDDADRFVEQIGLAAQPRRQRKHRNVETGQAGHEALRVSVFGSWVSEKALNGSRP